MRLPRRWSWSPSWSWVLALLPAAPGCAGGEGDPCDPFADRIVSFTPGPGAGFGQDALPGIVLGPPAGAGTAAGGTDVLSLGTGGEIVVALDGAGIVDGPGPDFIVFENAFHAAGDPLQPYAEPAAVAVSDDGARWREYPCASAGLPYAGCAGVSPVLSSPANGLDPTDPTVAGGDAFDLADVGLDHASFVRIRDLGGGLPGGSSAGFDLDAVASVHGCLE